MSFSVTVIQTLSAFVIFVAAYLVVLVAIICGLVLASCIHKGGRLMKAYTLRTACRDRDWSLAEDGLHHVQR
jgi:hypothetical protein